MKALIYGIIGGIFSFILFMLLYDVIGIREESRAILAGTIVLSTVICGCTGILVQKM